MNTNDVNQIKKIYLVRLLTKALKVKIEKEKQPCDHSTMIYIMTMLRISHTTIPITYAVA